MGLTQALGKLSRRVAPKFTYTSIQLNNGYSATMHVDGNNNGPSMLIALGNFTGGRIWIYDPEGPDVMTVPSDMHGWK